MRGSTKAKTRRQSRRAKHAIRDSSPHPRLYPNVRVVRRRAVPRPKPVASHGVPATYGKGQFASSKTVSKCSSCRGGAVPEGKTRRQSRRAKHAVRDSSPHPRLYLNARVVRRGSTRAKTRRQSRRAKHAVRQFASSKTVSKCSSCAAGSTRAKTRRQSRRKTCGKGQFALSAKTGTCSSCSAGQYQGLTIATKHDCETCGIRQIRILRFGKFVFVVSRRGGTRTSVLLWSTHARPVLRGKYLDAVKAQTNNSVCTSCDGGRYSDEGDAQTSISTCKACVAGKYSDAGIAQSDPKACKACPTGRSTPCTASASFLQCLREIVITINPIVTNIQEQGPSSQFSVVAHGRRPPSVQLLVHMLGGQGQRTVRCTILNPHVLRFSGNANTKSITVRFLSTAGAHTHCAIMLPQWRA